MVKLLIVFDTVQLVHNLHHLYTIHREIIIELLNLRSLTEVFKIKRQTFRKIYIINNLI